jgi:hypothetical protein
MENLGQIRAHARSLTRGEDHDGETRIGHERSRERVERDGDVMGVSRRWNLP